MHRPIAIAAFALLAPVAGGLSAAQAQCAFDQSFPNANDVLRESDPAMDIQFTVPLELQEVRLLGPDNTPWPIDWSATTEEVRETRFRATRPLAPGRYMIEWNGYVRRHYHADGGSITFTVATADGDGGVSPGGAPPASAAPRDAAAGPYRALLGARVQQADR